MLSSQTIWIDIENPPQVQYLAPFVSAFSRHGHSVTVTARDTGITVELLRGRGIHPHVVGSAPPAGKMRKVAAVARRAAGLYRIARDPRPAAVLCSSRPAALIARAIGVPCFVMCDYEYAELNLYRRLHTILLHPDVVPASRFVERGFRQDRLIAFRGVKEDISFTGIDIASQTPHDFGSMGAGVERILVRPPAESSHYFDPRSRALVLALLDYLAAREDVLTVFAPRHQSQVRDVEARRWRRPPAVLQKAVPFVSLLKGVDRVVSAGGTMLREAAYLGVPAYSLFAGSLGAVDEYLRRTGRLQVLASASQFDAVTEPVGDLPPFPRNDDIIVELMDAVLARAA